MKRRTLLAGGAGALLLPALSFAQGGERLARVGVLSPFIGPDSAFFEVLRTRLQELGYVEGKNAAYLYRAAEDYEGLARHAAEMVRLQAHVIVTAGAPGVRAAMSATKTTPIVIANVGDAVAQGFVASLARPGGNVTGLTSLNTELSVKRLDLLADALPSIRLVVALGEAVGDSGPLQATEAAARARGLKLEVMRVREADELASAFAAMPAGRGTALCVIQGPLFTSQLRRVVELAAARGLPAMYPDSRYVEVGGLMSYGPNIRELYRQAAAYVDRILKGGTPATMPVAQPSSFELALNLKTARSLGVTISRDVLTRADIALE
jgi:putative ABC transport system substrate-binding protein